MKNFSMFCKTYSKDLPSFELLLTSFHRHNRDNIHLYVSVDAEELSIFSHFASDNVEIIAAENYAKDYLTTKSYHGLSAGYINQEICKLSFWETGLTSNYLCLDSDCQFIRDFYITDFMADENTPYTVLVMDKDLSIEKHYQNFWRSRQSFIQKIYNEVGSDDRRLRTCHGMQVLSSTVLESLKTDFMAKNGYIYKDLIRISPYEFTWYNAWFQRCGLIKEYSVEPFFKTFHMRIDYNFSRLKLLKQEDLEKAYVGIVLNSNWRNGTIQSMYRNPNIFFKILYRFFK